MFPHNLRIEVWEEDANTWIPYWDTHLDGVRPLRAPEEWCIYSRYFGRGTRNPEVGVCFRDRNALPPPSSVMIGAPLAETLQPVKPFQRFRFFLDDVLLGEVEVPLRSEWVRMTGMLETMNLPAPVNVGQRLEIIGMELRDIRTTDQWECSGLHFRMI